MPKYVKKYRKKKRNYRRRRRKRFANPSVMVSRSLIVPDQLRTRLRYTVSIQLGGAVDTFYSIRGNALHDCNYTISGNQQPAGFDQLATLYNRYTVSGSSAKVSALSVNGSTAQLITLLPIPESNYLTNALTAKEQQYSKSRLTGFTSNGGPVYLSSYMSTKKIRGDRYLDSNYQALITQNPNKMWYWQLYCSAMDGVTPSEADGLFEVTYYVTFSRREEQEDA